MKKPRHRPTATPAPRHPFSFTLHPLSLACLVALAGPAFALPTGGTVVGGQATIVKPTPSLQVVTQNTQKAVIDWTTFSIASGETVRFDQPSSSAVLLNRVTGYDPSAIFGQMQSNGRIFLLNPYGVVFGASARVDVGGLVASSLSLSTADFMAGRFSLSSSGDTVRRGEVRNEGTISAPGGVVVLAGPVVSNTGTIAAAGGRVGLAAAQEALVDVEGDGLIFFRTTGSEAGNRLAQLGRIQADGGSVELRAAARGAFADTVLNMGGVVQARSLGVKEGRVVIDGGDAGVTRVAGTVDASGAGPGEHGGQVSVRGQKVLLDLAAVLNASGDAGGGKVTVGGDWQGQGASAELGANAEMTHVASGARIDVGATGRGDGGTAVVWSDGATHFAGAVQARGGADGGDGGQVEVSGKQQLAFAGSVVTLAPRGHAGALLLDPTDITIAAGGTNQTTTSTPPAPFTIEGNQGASNLPVGTLTALLNSNGSVTVDATAGTGGTGSISVETPIAWNSGNSLTLKADTTIESTGTGSITNIGTGGLSLFTDGAITLRAPVSLSGGSFTVRGTAGGVADRAASFTTTSTISTSATAAGGNAGNVSIQTTGALDIQGALTAVGAAGSDGALSGDSGGNGGNGGNVSLSTTAGTVATLGINADGGAGGAGHDGTDNGSSHGGSGGNGGNAGTLQLTSAGAGNDTTVGGALVARGGIGGNGGNGSGGNANGGDGGKGGNGAAVSVSAGARVLLGTAGTVATGGGAGGTPGAAGTSGNAGTALGPGARANITIAAGTDFTVTSALDTTGGTGTGSVSLTVGAAGAGGTLDLGAPGLISAGALSVAGGAGTDKIVATLTGAGGFVRTSGTPGTLVVNGQSAGITSIEDADVTGSAADNTINVAGFGGVATIRASGGTDSVTGNGANTTLVGANAPNTWSVTADGTGTLNGNTGTSFSAVSHLLGGSGTDTFTLASGVSAVFTGSIDGGGGGGANTLALTDGTNAIGITGTRGGTVNSSTFSRIDNMAAGSGTNSITGPATDTVFTITGANAVTVAGIAATSVQSLVGGAGNDTFTLGAGVTSFNGSIDGAGGSGNTLRVTDGTNTFAFGATDAGTLNGSTTFTNIGTLTGSGADTLTVASDVATLTLSDTSLARTGLSTVTLSGIQTASLRGGAGANSIDASGFTGDVGVQATAGADAVTGNGSRTTLNGTNNDSAYAISAARTGTLAEVAIPANATDFSGVGHLVGGSGADTFTLASGVTTFNGSIDGGTGSNTLVLLRAGNTIAVSAANTGTVNASTAFSGIATLTGSGSDSLSGPAAGTAYSIAGANAVTVAGIGATGIATLAGGAAGDTFTLTVSSFGGTIDGGGGNNTLVLANVPNTIAISGANAGTVNTSTAFSGISTLAGGSGTDTLTGPAAGTAYTITGANAVSVAGIAATSIELINGGAGNDSFTLGSGVTSFAGSIDGAGGTNTLAATAGTNAFSITGADSGTLNTTTLFANIANLTGGSGNDGFVFGVAGTLSGSVDGGTAGADTLDLGAKTGVLVVDQGGTSTHDGAAVLGGFANIGALAGNGTNTTLVGPGTGQTFTLAGELAGTAGSLGFTGVTALAGGSGVDTLVVSNDVANITLSNTSIARTGFSAIALSGFEAASLGGGAGINTLTASAFSGTVSLRATAGADTVIGNGANSTLVGTNAASTFAVTGIDAVTLTQGLDITSATGVGNLAGGAANDSFAIQNAGTLSGGINGGGGTNTLDLSQKTGATIVFNQGSSTISGVGVAGAITNVGTVIGNGANTSLLGNNTGQTFAITANNEITVDGAQVFQGVGNLNAGSGADTISGTVFHLDGNVNDAGGTTTLLGTIATLGSQTYIGRVVAAAPLALSAGGSISATNAANDFSTLSLATSGSAGTTIVDANDLTLGAVSLLGSGANSISAGTAVGSTLARTATLTATNAPTLTVGGVVVNNGVRDLFTTGSATSVQLQAGTAGTHNVAATGVSLLPSMTVTGNLAVTGTSIAEAGPLIIGGTTSVNAGAGSIALTAANDFQGAVSLTGATTQITDANALTLGTLATGTLTATSTGALNLGQGAVTGNLLATSNGGAVTQSAALTVTGTTSVNAGAGSIALTAANDFQGAVSLTGATTQITDANALTLGTLATGTLTATSTGALNLGQGAVTGNLLATSNGGAVSQSAALTVTGTTSVNAGAGSIALTAANDFQGAVSLTGATTQITDANALTLGTLATGTLTATSTGALNLGQGTVTGNLVAASNGGAVSQSAALTVTGTTSVNAGAGSIALTAANDFQGAVSLTGATTQITDANALTLGTLATGTLTATSTGALNLGQGAVTGNLLATSNGGAVSQSAALTVTGTTSVNAGAGSIALTAANDFQGTVSLTGATTQITDANALTLGTLATGTLTATSTGALNLGQGAVTGNLLATSNGGAVSQSAALTVTGTTSVNAGAGSIALTAANDFQGAVSLTGATTQITDANALSLATISIAPGQTLTVTAGGPITLGSGIATTADQTFAGNVALAGDVTLSAGSGRITLQGDVDGGDHGLTLSSSAAAADAIRTGGAVFNVASFTSNGRLALGGSVTSSGNQTYAGPVLLTDTATLTGVDISLQGAVDGAQSLVLAGSGTTTLGAAVGGITALVSLTDAGSGTTRIGDNVTTSGAQVYGGAIALTGPSTLSGSTLRLDGPIDGAQALALGSTVGTTLNGAVGATTALTTIGVSGPITFNGPSVRTSGAQTYAGASTLGGDLALAGDGITFTGAIDGRHALTIQNGGGTSFGAAIGSTAPLAALTLNGGGPVLLNGPSVDTVGTQHYGGHLQVNGNTRLSGDTLQIGAGIGGAQDLLLQADTLSTAGALVGTGTLTIEPVTAGRSIGVAGAAGGLQVSQALLTSTSGFTEHRIGRIDGTGGMEVGVLQLTADTTLNAGAGNLTLSGTVDGPFALALNSGGATRLLGSIGTGSALRSLVTDNVAGAADWDGTAGEHTQLDVAGGARIVTTGDQTFNDPLVAPGGVRFDGGVVTATQASNEIRGTVDAGATQLNLASHTPLVLGNITLAGGGRIESAQTLELAGALRLNGGTLSLVASGQPTALADFADPELAGQQGRFNSGAREASATIFQGEDGTVATVAGSLLVLRSPQGGSILLNNEPDAQHPSRQNDLLGGLSAVSGAPGSTTTTDTLGFVRITSTEIHAAGAPPADGSPSLLEAGIEGDVLKLSADKIATGSTGQLRARLPYSNVLGSRDSIPGLTLIMSPTALTIGGGFGLATPDGYIQVHVGNELGGYVTVRPRGATGENAFILLAGPEPRPFYDLNGKADEVRIFYNGDAPRTPQETGALSALMAIVEDARQTRFEEAVRTENVKSRLRSGVIAEVGAGRPATVGRESIRLPSSCNPKDTTLQCE